MPRSRPPGVVALVAARYELIRELRGGAETVEWEAFDSALERPVVVQLLRPQLANDDAAVERFWQTARAAARGIAVVGERVLDGGTDPETGQLFVVRERPAQPLANEEPRFIPPFVRHVSPASKPALHRFVAPQRWLLACGGVVVLLLATAMIRSGLENWLAWVNSPMSRSDQSLGLAPAVAVPASGAQPGQSTSTPAAAPPTVAPAARTAPAATTVATPLPAPAPPTGGQTRRIVNTDGRGVALRTSPGGDRLPAKGYDEGATVQALEQSGDWTHIRGSDGRDGWVLTVTLAP